MSCFIKSGILSVLTVGRYGAVFLDKKQVSLSYPLMHD